MDINEYLSKHQPIVYNTFKHALENNQLSHAYLLSGTPGMPLKEVALFLAKSIVCESPSPLACNKCLTCIRIDDGNYLDIKVIGGEKNKIKKEEIQDIIESFSSTANEKNGKVIYIINYVETMTVVAVNSLLKFLEEPGKDVYAILTTENESKVLPTIKSRTQTLKMRAIDRDKIIEEAKNLDVSSEDAELLSMIYNDANTIKEYCSSNQYKIIKEALTNTLDGLTNNQIYASYTLEKSVIPNIKTNETASIYLSLLSSFFLDLLNFSYKSEITLKSYVNIIEKLSDKLKHISYSLMTILSSKNQLDVNVNIPLLLNHLIYEITKE